VTVGDGGDGKQQVLSWTLLS